jgi:hypothetical protein
MDLTTPSSVLQAENTNDKSDFLLQDTNEEHKVEGIVVSTSDSGSKDFAFRLQRREDEEQGLEVSCDATMLAVESVMTQSQVANELDDDPLAQNTDAYGADEISMEQSLVANCDLRLQIETQAQDVQQQKSWKCWLSYCKRLRMGMNCKSFACDFCENAAQGGPMLPFCLGVHCQSQHE